MSEFANKIFAHAQHVQRMGVHCTTEETTKQALILPLLDILGFNPYDPTKVKAEYSADFAGAKNGERVDYALFCQDLPVMLIEAKAYNENLSNHAPQLARYFNATPEVEFAIITNGREWRFFTDLKNKNLMDDKPFLRINFEEQDQSKIDSLARFCHDNFQADALRTLAEESLYLSQFTKTITQALQEVPTEFVRYVAANSNVGRQLSQRFLDSISPIVKQAIERAMSTLVVSGLATPSDMSVPATIEEASLQETPNNGDIIDPNNAKIITTKQEQTLFDYVCQIVDDPNKISYKDNETYFSILYQGKSNRWLCRQYAEKSGFSLVVPLELTDSHKQEILRAGLELKELTNRTIITIKHSEDIFRISGIMRDCFAYCQDDENFRMKK
ncbi:type I restriction endonuclease [Haemophilus parahaemolyticus]|uniref:type I restriction endonuclease n=1 Tax=Haemophilus parahaemolyticus TaxID=735 RepID=UPI002490061C|nr:type I restriction endonuclease [Haemophilus parahaemolyticus]